MSKYTDAQYLAAEYFSPDEDETNYSRKIVTTRKDGECSSLGAGRHPIPKGTRAISERAIVSGQGFVSNHLCLECADTWLDQTTPEETK